MNDPESLDIYQQRIAEIQDVSDVVAVANLQLNKILQRFGWTKQSLHSQVSIFFNENIEQKRFRKII